MRYGFYSEYISVADRKKNATQTIEKLRKKDSSIDPVILEGRTIAKTFWGKAWCENLENYADYDNRLERGRSYVRCNTVCDLKIEADQIIATVIGSSMYTLTIKVAPLPSDKWEKIRAKAVGKISNLLDVLKGTLPDDLIHDLCDVDNGLFPSLDELEIICSCPDYANMCKHVAAVLYGVGHRLDSRPELLFSLRQVDINELLATETYIENITFEGNSQDSTLMDNDLASLESLFGIELTELQESKTPKKNKSSAQSKTKNKRIHHNLE